MASLIHNIARLETAASAELGGLSLNNDDEGFLGKMLREDTISDQNTYVKEWDDSISNYKTVKTIYGLGNGEKIVYAIICALIPTAIAIVGIIICVRRKYL